MDLKRIDERGVLDFVQNLIELYFDRRDMAALPDFMDERISWIGTGEGELSHDLDEARSALAAELSECSGGFTVDKTDFEYMPLSDTFGIVYGTINAVPSDQSLADERLRLSVVLEQAEDGLKLVHMHFSHADPVPGAWSILCQSGRSGRQSESDS